MTSRHPSRHLRKHSLQLSCRWWRNKSGSNSSLFSNKSNMRSSKNNSANTWRPFLHSRRGSNRHERQRAAAYRHQLPKSNATRPPSPMYPCWHWGRPKRTTWNGIFLCLSILQAGLTLNRTPHDIIVEDGMPPNPGPSGSSGDDNPDNKRRRTARQHNLWEPM